MTVNVSIKRVQRHLEDTPPLTHQPLQEDDSSFESGAAHLKHAGPDTGTSVI